MKWLKRAREPPSSYRTNATINFIKSLLRGKTMKKVRKITAIMLAVLMMMSCLPTAGIGAEAAHRHTWSYVSSQKATCLSSGRTTYLCKCGQKKYVYSNALGHSYSIKSRKTPTCTQNGYTVSVCSRCGKTSRTVLPAWGHKVHGRKYKKNGIYWRSCSRCGVEVKQ